MYAEEIYSVQTLLCGIESYLTQLSLNPKTGLPDHCILSEELFKQKIHIFNKNFAGKTGDPYNLEEARDFQNKMSSPDLPLLNIFKKIHEIVRHEFVDDYKSSELSSMDTVIKDDVFYLAKPEELKRITLIPLFEIKKETLKASIRP
jgi:hypothetical protein